MTWYERRARECGTKVAYLSERLAANAALLHAWAGRTGLAPYRCSFCADWHVGHPRRGQGATEADLPVAVSA